jgi:hypothetical protein
MVKPTDKYEWEYRLLALEVKGPCCSPKGMGEILICVQVPELFSKSVMILKSTRRSRYSVFGGSRLL